MAHISGKTARAIMAGLLITAAIPAGAARAGFEWKPAPRQPTAQAADALPPAPAVPPTAVEQAPLSAMPETSTAVSPTASAPVAAAPTVSAVEPAVAPSPLVTPPAAQPSAAPPIPVPVAATPAPAVSAAVPVTGFGRDMPLVMAMSQIIPADYAYSFDQGVNPGLRINWDGGRPWAEVLEQALGNYGLKASIVDRTVRIMPAQSAAETAVPVAAPAMAAAASASSAAPAPVPAPATPLPVQISEAVTAPAAGQNIATPSVPSAVSLAPAMASEPVHTPVPEEMKPAIAETVVSPAPAPVAAEPSPEEQSTYVYAGTQHAETSSEPEQSYPRRQKPERPAVITAETEAAPTPMPEAAPVEESKTETVVAEAEPATEQMPDVTEPATIEAPAASEDSMAPSNEQAAPGEVKTEETADASVAPETVQGADAQSMEASEKGEAAPPEQAVESAPESAQETVIAEAPDAKPAPTPVAESAPASSSDMMDEGPVGLQAVRPWNAAKGENLKTVLEQWCRHAGVELYWTGMSDYALPEPVETTSSFVDAVRSILTAYDNAPQRPVGNLHTGDSKSPPTLIIKDYQTAMN